MDEFVEEAFQLLGFAWVDCSSWSLYLWSKEFEKKSTVSDLLTIGFIYFITLEYIYPQIT